MSFFFWLLIVRPNYCHPQIAAASGPAFVCLCLCSAQLQSGSYWRTTNAMQCNAMQWMHVLLPSLLPSSSVFSAPSYSFPSLPPSGWLFGWMCLDPSFPLGHNLFFRPIFLNRPLMSTRGKEPTARTWDLLSSLGGEAIGLTQDRSS
jgi:hypothetical protein